MPENYDKVSATRTRAAINLHVLTRGRGTYGLVDIWLSGAVLRLNKTHVGRTKGCHGA